MCEHWIGRDAEHVRVGEEQNKKMPVLGNHCPERRGMGRGAEVQVQEPHCQLLVVRIPVAVSDPR